MKFIGFSFNKMSIQKFSDNFKDLKINTNIDISNITPSKNEILKENEEILIVNFKFEILYEKNIAKVELEGTVLVAIDPKDAKKIVKEWKDKKLPEDFRIPLFNVILRKSNIKALQLEDEVHIPEHFPTPMFKKEEPN